MWTMMRQFQRWSACYRRVAGSYSDLVEALFAISLCAWLEGLLWTGAADVVTEPLARLALCLFIAVPLMLVSAGASYTKSSEARLLAQRPAIALYRVLGGNMVLVCVQQALLAMLRVMSGAAAGMFVAAQMLPESSANILFPFPFTALSALAAGVVLALRAVWCTWNVPAAYDLTVEQADGDSADAGIEESLRALHTNYAILARRGTDAVARYRKMVSPLLLLTIYTLLINKHSLVKHGPDVDVDALQADNDGDHSPIALTDGHLAATVVPHRHGVTLAAEPVDGEISIPIMRRFAQQFETDRGDTLAPGRPSREVHTIVAASSDFSGISIPVEHIAGSPLQQAIAEIYVSGPALNAHFNDPPKAVPISSVTPTIASTTALQVSNIATIGSAETPTLSVSNQNTSTTPALGVASAVPASAYNSTMPITTPPTGDIITVSSAGNINYTKALLFHVDLGATVMPHLEAAYTVSATDVQSAGILIVGQPILLGHVASTHLI